MQDDDDERDARIGRAIRFVRRDRGVSQKQLGAALGITMQQVSKYERGLNRVSLILAADIARALGVPLVGLLEVAEIPWWCPVGSFRLRHRSTLGRRSARPWEP